MQSVISKTLDYRRKIIFAAALSVKKWTIMASNLWTATLYTSGDHNAFPAAEAKVDIPHPEHVLRRCDT